MLGEVSTKFAQEGGQHVWLAGIGNIAGIDFAHLLPQNAVNLVGASVDGGLRTLTITQPDNRALPVALESFAPSSMSRVLSLQVCTPLLDGVPVDGSSVGIVDSFVAAGGVLEEECHVVQGGGRVAQC